MDIEETIQRETYREFDLVHLRQRKAATSRWHISRRESGIRRNYGFAASEQEAHLKIDDLLKRRTQGRKDLPLSE